MKHGGTVLLAATLVFEGCQATIPVATPHASSVSASWMQPEAQSQDLLYVATLGNMVYVFTYPALAAAGRLDLSSYYLQGLCVDASGDVFVPAWSPGRTSTSPPIGVVFKYAHGSTAYTKLSDPQAEPFGCAVDATTGNLAVSNTTSHGPYNDGNVVIYQGATGTPTSYTVPQMNSPQWLTYDSSGNLFVDGTDANDGNRTRRDLGQTLLAELPKGASTFQTIRFRQALGNGSLQWNQGSLTIASIEDTRGTIYRASIDGDNAKILGATKLRLHSNRYQDLQSQFWIQDTAVVGSGWHDYLQVWPYPKGGKPLQRLHTRIGLINGVVISNAD